MKNIVLSIALIGTSTISVAQNMLKNKLLEVYSPKQTESILNDSQKKEYFNTVLFHSFKIEEMKIEKTKNTHLKTLNSIEIKNIDGSTNVITPEEVIESFNNGSFNILRLNIERDLKKNKTYVLGNTNYLLRINSFESILKTKEQ